MGYRQGNLPNANRLQIPKVCVSKYYSCTFGYSMIAFRLRLRAVLLCSNPATSISFPCMQTPMSCIGLAAISLLFLNDVTHNHTTVPIDHDDTGIGTVWKTSQVRVTKRASLFLLRRWPHMGCSTAVFTHMKLQEHVPFTADYNRVSDPFRGVCICLLAFLFVYISIVSKSFVNRF